MYVLGLVKYFSGPFFSGTPREIFIIRWFKIPSFNSAIKLQIIEKNLENVSTFSKI